MHQPFCCNAKCIWHHHNVPPDTPHINFTMEGGRALVAHPKLSQYVDDKLYYQAQEKVNAAFKPGYVLGNLTTAVNKSIFMKTLAGAGVDLDQAPLKEVMNYKQLTRHKVKLGVEGLLIEDYFCVTCYEVWKMAGVLNT